MIAGAPPHHERVAARWVGGKQPLQSGKKVVVVSPKNGLATLPRRRG